MNSKTEMILAKREQIDLDAYWNIFAKFEVHALDAKLFEKWGEGVYTDGSFRSPYLAYTRAPKVQLGDLKAMIEFHPDGSLAGIYALVGEGPGIRVDMGMYRTVDNTGGTEKVISEEFALKIYDDTANPNVYHRSGELNPPEDSGRFPIDMPTTKDIIVSESSLKEVQTSIERYLTQQKGLEKDNTVQDNLNAIRTQ